MDLRVRAELLAWLLLVDFFVGLFLQGPRGIRGHGSASEAQ